MLLLWFALLLALVQGEWVYHYGHTLFSEESFMLYGRMAYGQMQHKATFQIQNGYSGVDVHFYLLGEALQVVTFFVRDNSEVHQECNVSVRIGHVGHHYSNLYKSVRDVVLENTKKGTQTVVVGSRYGGALAQIFAYDALYTTRGKFEIKGVVMFDTPKVGSQDFSARLCERIFCARVGERNVGFMHPDFKISARELVKDEL